MKPTLILLCILLTGCVTSRDGDIYRCWGVCRAPADAEEIISTGLIVNRIGPLKRVVFGHERMIIERGNREETNVCIGTDCLLDRDWLH